MVESVGQIRISRTWLTVTRNLWMLYHRDNGDIEVEKVHLPVAVLMLVKFGWVDCVLS
jgi:hypothetical protein